MCITTMYIVRHTQTRGNIEERLQGRTDFEITEEGKALISKLDDALKDIKFDKAYSSTSPRALKTILPIAIRNNLDVIQLKDLCEMDFGDYDGKTWNEVYKINPELKQLQHKASKIVGIPNQESTEHVAERMYNCIVNIGNENKGKTILICSHGVSMEAFFRKIARKDKDWSVDKENFCLQNANINIITFDSNLQKFNLSILNSTEHLK